MSWCYYKIVMLQRLKQALSQRQKRCIVDASRTSSAVLIPIFYKQEENHILFTKRAETVRNHKGQISFPGGTYEEQDGTLVNTVLRECSEEIGLPAEVIEVLGELDDMPTVSTNYIVSPFVAAIPWPHPLRVEPMEVKEIIEVPISVLLDKDCGHEGIEILDGEQIGAYFYHYREDVIWGATARILNQFLNIYTQVMGDCGG
ncbi:NUDIX hydrolase [Chloroflexota bacterium]